MTKSLAVLLLGVSMLLFVGCQDEWEQDGEPYTNVKPNDDRRAELLTAKSWKMTGYTEDGENTFNDYPACERDNITTFSPNGRYKEDEGATKCDQNDPQTYEEGTWKIDGDKLIITPNGSSLALNMTIVALNSTTLKLSGSNPFTNDPIIITFTAQ